MADDFVTIATFDDSTEANIVLGRLQSEDIECILQGENVANISPPLSFAQGGIKLQVRRADVEAASAILRENEVLNHRTATESPELHCPDCGAMGENIKRVPSMTFIIGAFLLTGGLLLLGAKRGWKCEKCQHFWKGAQSG